MEKECVYTEELKGVSILYENDFYQFAEVVVNILAAHDDYIRNQGKYCGHTRPTIFGLAKKYASIANIYFSDDYVLNILSQHGFSGREVVDIRTCESTSV